MKKIVIPKDFECDCYLDNACYPISDKLYFSGFEGDIQGKTILILDEGEKVYTEKDIKEELRKKYGREGENDRKRMVRKN